jgi:hypothetical protein
MLKTLAAFPGRETGILDLLTNFGVVRAYG